MNQSVQQITTYECTVTINFITLTVKFPCRMHLRYDNQKLTEEITCNQSSQFIFNRDLNLKDMALKGAFEVTINLTTEKGSNIVAGLIRMQVQDLLNSQGQMVSFGLYNCVDPYAKCQAKVIRIRKTKLKRDKSRIRTISGATSIRMDSKQKDLGNNSNILGKQYNWKESQRIIDQIPRQSTYRQSYLSPNMDKNLSQRRKSIHSRQKYKVQFDALENNLKLDIIKYKAKIQELQKANEEKERQIKNLTKELNNVKMNEYNQLYYNEELQNKNRLLETYESYLKELRKDNEQLRNKRFDMQKTLISFEESKKFELQKLLSDFEKSKFTLVKEVDSKKEDIKYLQFEIDNKNSKIQAMKRMIQQYQKKVQDAENEYNYLMKNERQQAKRSKELLENQLKCINSAFRIEEMTKKQLEKENQQLKNKLKDKQAQILLIIQQANITRPQYRNSTYERIYRANDHQINKARTQYKNYSSTGPYEKSSQNQIKLQQSHANPNYTAISQSQLYRLNQKLRQYQNKWHKQQLKTQQLQKIIQSQHEQKERIQSQLQQLTLIFNQIFANSSNFDELSKQKLKLCSSSLSKLNSFIIPLSKLIENNKKSIKDFDLRYSTTQMSKQPSFVKQKIDEQTAEGVIKNEREMTKSNEIIDNQAKYLAQLENENRQLKSRLTEKESYMQFAMQEANISMPQMRRYTNKGTYERSNQNQIKVQQSLTNPNDTSKNIGPYEKSSQNQIKLQQSHANPNYTAISQSQLYRLNQKLRQYQNKWHKQQLKTQQLQKIIQSQHEQKERIQSQLQQLTLIFNQIFANSSNFDELSKQKLKLCSSSLSKLNSFIIPLSKLIENNKKSIKDFDLRYSTTQMSKQPSFVKQKIDEQTAEGVIKNEREMTKSNEIIDNQAKYLAQLENENRQLKSRLTEKESYMQFAMQEANISMPQMRRYTNKGTYERSNQNQIKVQQSLTNPNDTSKNIGPYEKSSQNQIKLQQSHANPNYTAISQSQLYRLNQKLRQYQNKWHKQQLKTQQLQKIIQSQHEQKERIQSQLQQLTLIFNQIFANSSNFDELSKQKLKLCSSSLSKLNSFIIPLSKLIENNKKSIKDFDLRYSTTQMSKQPSFVKQKIDEQTAEGVIKNEREMTKSNEIIDNQAKYLAQLENENRQLKSRLTEKESYMQFAMQEANISMPQMRRYTNKGTYERSNQNQIKVQQSLTNPNDTSKNIGPYEKSSQNQIKLQQSHANPNYTAISQSQLYRLNQKLRQYQNKWHKQQLKTQQLQKIIQSQHEQKERIQSQLQQLTLIFNQIFANSSNFDELSKQKLKLCSSSLSKLNSFIIPLSKLIENNKKSIKDFDLRYSTTQMSKQPSFVKQKIDEQTAEGVIKNEREMTKSNEIIDNQAKYLAQLENENRQLKSRLTEKESYMQFAMQEANISMPQMRRYTNKGTYERSNQNQIKVQQSLTNPNDTSKNIGPYEKSSQNQIKLQQSHANPNYTAISQSQLYRLNQKLRQYQNKWHKQQLKTQQLQKIIQSQHEQKERIQSQLQQLTLIFNQIFANSSNFDELSKQKLKLCSSSLSKLNSFIIPLSKLIENNKKSIKDFDLRYSTTQMSKQPSFVKQKIDEQTAEGVIKNEREMTKSNEIIDNQAKYLAQLENENRQLKSRLTEKESYMQFAMQEANISMPQMRRYTNKGTYERSNQNQIKVQQSLTNPNDTSKNIGPYQKSSPLIEKQPTLLSSSPTLNINRVQHNNNDRHQNRAQYIMSGQLSSHRQIYPPNTPSSNQHLRFNIIDDVLNKSQRYGNNNHQHTSKYIQNLFNSYLHKNVMNIDQYNILIGQRQEAKVKLQILQNQVRYLDSAIKFKDITIKQLQNETRLLKNKIKDKDEHIQIIIHENGQSNSENKKYVQEKVVLPTNLKIKQPSINHQKFIASPNFQLSNLREQLHEQQLKLHSQQLRTHELQRIIQAQNQQKAHIQSSLQQLQQIFNQLLRSSSNFDQNSKQKMGLFSSSFSKLNQSVGQYIIFLPKIFQNHKKHIQEIVLRSSNPQLRKQQVQIKPKVRDLRQLLLNFSQLNHLFSADIQKRSDQAPIQQTLISSKTIALDKVFKKFNEYLRKYKQKANELYKNCQRLKLILQSQFDVKNDLKTHNIQLINQKAEIGLADVEKMRSIMTLEAENAQLKLQIRQIMEDYHKRIEVISSLKNNLAHLNESIQNSQQQKYEFQSRTDKYEEKIKKKQFELKNKNKQILQLEDRYKEIIQFYIKEIQKHNATCEAERDRLVDEKNKAKEQLYLLKIQRNQVKLENAKIMKQLNFLNTSIKIDKLTIRKQG